MQPCYEFSWLSCYFTKQKHSLQTIQTSLRCLDISRKQHCFASQESQKRHLKIISVKCVCVCSFWTSLPLMSSDSQAKMKPQSASRWGKSDQGQGDVQTVVYRYKCCQWLLLALKEEHDTAELKKYSTGSEWRRMCAHLMSLQDIHVFVSLFTSRWMESLSPHSLSQCALSHRRPWGRDKLCLTGLIHSRSQTLKPEWTAAFLPSWETTEFIRLFCFLKGASRFRLCTISVTALQSEKPDLYLWLLPSYKLR